MYKVLPKTATVQDIQKQYRTLFDDVIESKEPLVVFNRNQPEVVVVDINTYELLMQSKIAYEEQLAQEATDIYLKEKAEGKLKKLGSLRDLMD